MIRSKEMRIFQFIGVIILVIGTAWMFSISSDGSGAPAYIEGELVCYGCELKCGGPTSNTCDYYEHKGVLRDAHGDFWYFDDTPVAKPLIQDESLRGKQLRVYGKINEETHTITVDRWREL